MNDCFLDLLLMLSSKSSQHHLSLSADRFVVSTCLPTFASSIDCIVSLPSKPPFASEQTSFPKRSVAMSESQFCPLVYVLRAEVTTTAVWWSSMGDTFSSSCASWNALTRCADRGTQKHSNVFTRLSYDRATIFPRAAAVAVSARSLDPCFNKSNWYWLYARPRRPPTIS